MTASARRQLAILLPVLLAATLLLACSSDDEPPPAAAFYLEVAVEVEPSHDDPLARFGSAEGRSLIRWWYAPAPDRWRWEIESIGTTIDDGVALTVFDGDDSWGYDDRSNTHRRDIAPLVPPGMVLPPTFSAPVGPANVETVEAFMQQWRDRVSDADVQLAGEATLLGRPTQIVEIRPAWSGSSESAQAPAPGQDSQPSTQQTESSGGVVRVFIDPERMFIMRWAVDGEGGGQSYRSEVTRLDYDTEIDPARFSFDPPSGAIELTSNVRQSCSGSSGMLGGPSVPAQPGFLLPSYVPPGYTSTGSGSGSGANGDCGPVSTWVLLESPDGASILLRQRDRPGGIPQAARSWQPVDSNLDDSYRQSAPGIERLLWRNGDVVAVLESDSVPFEDLLRIAESSELVP